MTPYASPAPPGLKQGLDSMLLLRVLGQAASPVRSPSSCQESLVLSAVVRRSSLLLLGHPPIHRTVGVRHLEAGLTSIEIPIKLTRMQVD